MNNQEFQAACMEYLQTLKSLAPYDTGNLALNSIKIEYKDEKTCVIYVDENIAPYMPYTNEPWVAKRWGGKKNPNQDWWSAANELCAEQIAKKLNGVLK